MCLHGTSFFFHPSWNTPFARDQFYGQFFILLMCFYLRKKKTRKNDTSAQMFNQKNTIKWRKTLKYTKNVPEHKMLNMKETAKNRHIKFEIGFGRHIFGLAEWFLCSALNQSDKRFECFNLTRIHKYNDFILMRLIINYSMKWRVFIGDVRWLRDRVGDIMMKWGKRDRKWQKSNDIDRNCELYESDLKIKSASGVRKYGHT